MRLRPYWPGLGERCDQDLNLEVGLLRRDGLASRCCTIEPSQQKKRRLIISLRHRGGEVALQLQCIDEPIPGRRLSPFYRVDNPTPCNYESHYRVSTVQLSGSTSHTLSYSCGQCSRFSAGSYSIHIVSAHRTFACCSGHTIR